MLPRSLAILTMLFVVMSVASPQAKGDPIGDIGGLVKVKTNDYKAVFGELKKDDATGVTVIDLTTGKDRVVNRADVKTVERDISDDDAAAATNLPTLLAWKIKKMQPAPVAPKVGKVALVNGDIIYVTLGANKSIAVGDHLTAFRKGAEVKDPDTGKVLGSVRLRLAEMEITEVKADYSQATVIGMPDIKLQVGDEVQPSIHPPQVAVFDPVDSTGNTTEAGTALAEQLTARLVEDKVTVVDRARLKAALTELAMQTGALFEPEAAQKLGRQIGATAILTGKIVAGSGKLSEAQMRLIDVATGKIVMATSSTLRASAAVAGAAAHTPEIGNVAEDRIVAEEELRTASNGGYNPHVYKLDVPADKPKVSLASSTINFQMIPKDNSGGFDLRLEISIDYGKTYFEAAKIDTAAMMKAHRAGDWFHVPLAGAGTTLAAKRALRAAGDLDEILVRVQGRQGPITDVQMVNWSH